VFDGGHEVILDAALTWLARQKKGPTPSAVR
jgi:hypothetical protein